MDDEPLSFEEHRRRRDDNAGTVRCARCGKWIVATATRCPQCGVHFQGEAQEFTHASEMPRTSAGLPGWVVLTAVLSIALMVIGLVWLR